MSDFDERTQNLVDEFARQFGGQPAWIAIGPGRVNLIGEHTDYNDGFVMPVALQRDVRVAVRARQDRLVRIYSSEYDDWGEFDLDAIAYQKDKLWINYVQGVASILEERGLTLTGIDAVLSGNVPRASGLSSSAALEVASIKGLMAAAGISDELPGTEIAKIAQRAENQFVGVNCGIMDQFISVLGVKGHALLIDCRSLDYELVPFPANAALVIGNTKAPRSLASSAYNERRQQCEEGVAALQQVLPDITALRDVSSEQLEVNKELLSPIVYQRCRHVVSENERVMQTVEALKRDDLQTVGKLMSASHASLRDDYAVSSDALNAMVEAMSAVRGCYGARLTGAGFGGCAIALVDPGREQAVADAIYQEYPKATNIWPEVYTTQASAGARVIEGQ
jgi:galactokinase